MNDFQRRLTEALKQARATPRVTTDSKQRRSELLYSCQMRPVEQWRLHDFTDEELADISAELDFEKKQALSHEILCRSEERLQQASIYSYIKPGQSKRS